MIGFGQCECIWRPSMPLFQWPSSVLADNPLCPFPPCCPLRYAMRAAQAGTWQPGPALPSSMTPGLSFVSSAAVSGRLYAIGGSSFHSPVAVLDRQDQEHGGGSYSYSWTPSSPLLTPRVNMAATTCAGVQIFALG